MFVDLTIVLGVPLTPVLVYLPKQIRQDLEVDLLRFGSLVLQPSTLALTRDVENHPPTLRAHDTWGRRIDELSTSHGWKSLQEVGIAEGIVAIPYEDEYGTFSRVYQFLKSHMWTGSSAMVGCPSAMQDGAACLLKAQLSRMDLSAVEREVFERAYNHLTSRDPREAWTSGQWMTERTGGSDVRNTETQATFSPEFPDGSSTQDIDGSPLGPWSISGFKWFSSATDSAMAVMLARDPSGSISTFYTPMRRRLPSSLPDAVGTELNGIQIQRLKNKLGTKGVPTAELVLKGTRAYLIGEQGKGTKEISRILNVTRLHTAIGSVGHWGRGLAISRAFSLVRKANGHFLIDSPAHVRTLAEQHVEYHAMMHLAFFSAALTGASESAVPPGGAPSSNLFTRESASLLLRLVTPLAKALTTKAAIAGLAECMESLGGIGYLENEDILFNIARLYRDVNVNSIWEGTTNVMAHDVVRVLKGPGAPHVLNSVDTFICRATEQWKAGSLVDHADPAEALSSYWTRTKHTIESQEANELLHKGRDLMKDLGWIFCAALLGEDARSDSHATAAKIFRRYLASKVDCRSRSQSWKAEAEWDRRIVFGKFAGERPKL